MNEPLNWDDVRLFLAVAEEGSFRQAALKSGVGHTTLSRRIEALEQNLGTKLFVRKSTGLKLTDAGEDMLKTAVPMREEFSGLQARLFGEEQEVSGMIRVTVPHVLLNYFLLEELKTFCERWPEIRFDIDTSLDIVDLRSREADLAVRMTNTPGDYYVGRSLGRYCEAVYASHAYLDRFEAENRAEHVWVSPGDDYEFVAEFYDEWRVDDVPSASIVLPDVQSQMQAAESSMGIATLPCVMGDQNEKLIKISEPYFRTDIWLLSHPDTRGNKRMQLCREFLVEVFGRYQDLLDGKST